MEKRVKKITLPTILVFVIIVGLLSISIYYMYIAFQSRNLTEAFSFILFAATGIAISLYIMYIIRRRTLSQKPQPRVITTIECKKCGFKTLRKFEKGDYVFKSVENCQKCNEPMLITTVYAEETKK